MESRAGFREKIRDILSVNDTPHIIALSFAVGVFFGISPLIGLHTILGLVAAWIFRLNKVIVLSGVYVTNPWSIVPIYTFCTWLGTILLGVEITTATNWKNIKFGSITESLGPLLLPFVTGTTIVAFVAAAVGYVLTRRATEKIRKMRRKEDT